MGREVRERIEQLREKMAERGMDAFRHRISMARNM